MNVKVKRLNDAAVIPQYAKLGDSGFDLVATEDVIIAPGETALVPTGLAFEIPDGYELQIRPRSGVSLRTKLRVANTPGTVDSSYRGEVKVIIDNIARQEPGSTPRLRNLNGGTEYYNGQFYDKYTYIIRKGDRFCQAVIAPIIRASFDLTEELGDSERGGTGFGSSGHR